MVSIRRRRQIRVLIIFSLILTVIISAILIAGFFPFGLHKRAMKDVAMPKDAIMYMSVESLNSSVMKIINSIYAYRISHDEAMFEFSLMLKSIESFFDHLSDNPKLSIKYFSKYILKRNASVLFWRYGSNFNNAEIYFMFDLGKLPAYFFNIFVRQERIVIEDKNYDINRVRYGNAIISSLQNGNEVFAYFMVYKGLFIFSKEYNHLKKMVDFLNSKASNLKDVAALKNVDETYVPDMSLYINKELYDNINGDTNFLFSPLKYFSDASSIYTFIKFYENKGVLDIYIDYKYGASDRYSLYNIGGVTNIQNYLSKDNTIMYFALKSHLAGLYPLMYNDVKNDKDGKISKMIYDSFNRFNNLYSFSDIIKDINGEVGFTYAANSASGLIYPVMIFEVKNESKLFPLFEMSLVKKYNNVRKTQKSYNNNFIYTYFLSNGNELHYTSKDNIYFISEYEDGIENIIDGFYGKTSLSQYIYREARNITNPDYILTFDFLRGQNIFKELGMPLKTWSYPNSIIAGSTVGSNNTHIQVDFYANLKSLE